MNPKLKNFLLIVAKTAVGAVLTNAVLMASFSMIFNVTTTAGWIALAKATGAVIIGAEGKVWLPIVLSWTGTSVGGNPPPPSVAPQAKD